MSPPIRSTCLHRAVMLVTGVAACMAPISAAIGQATIDGRVTTARHVGSAEVVPLTAVRAFASLDEPDAEALAFRTWETEPAGWYRLSGAAGRYAAIFSSPAHHMRPVVLTNIFVRDGEKVALSVHPAYDFACFYEGGWDPEPARGYLQPFVGRGTSVTHVGFKLATDGVDGAGPGSQDVRISVHRVTDRPPGEWEQIGPTATARDVDCGGPKSYWYAAGWSSGEVVTEPGVTYAVRLLPGSEGGVFQAFWRPVSEDATSLWRTDGERWSEVSSELWLAVASDGDGLVIPYRKRVSKKFHELTLFGRKWSQTYVARGRSLASAILYAAVHGAQPPLSRQRVRVRVREEGPAGPVVGREKIAVGNGNYTGDASWGTFGLAYAPGEVPLVPGRTYAVEFESIENISTLHGFVNIKGEVSDDRPGFNPYRKCPPDTYEDGEAFYLGTEKVEYDLDLEIVEYEAAARNWESAAHAENLLPNGDMESGKLVPGDPVAGRPANWIAFASEGGTEHHYVNAGPAAKTRILRLVAGGAGGKASDGGWVQRVAGLSATDTYRLAGRVRSSWPLSADQKCLVGYDPTGQTDDPDSEEIVWARFAKIHGVFVAYSSLPIRPESDAVSIWLRLDSAKEERFPIRADFDDFSLCRVRTDVPRRR